MQENSPSLWRHAFPLPNQSSHKYSRGTLVVSGGPLTMTGAARLAATAALRIGAGLVTIAVPEAALAVYAASLLAVMVEPVNTTETFHHFIADPRRTALLLGPGNGLSERTRSFTLAALASQKPCVLDADSLSVFADTPSFLIDALHNNVVLTPHAGEFKRLFPVTGNRVADAQRAARQTGSVLLYKGAETIIAHPDGRVVVNRNAPSWLATAGSGDVLAGMIAGLVAGNVEPFTAACMAVWLHAETANQCGLGLIADDIPAILPTLLQKTFLVPHA